MAIVSRKLVAGNIYYSSRFGKNFLVLKKEVINDGATVLLVTMWLTGEHKGRVYVDTIADFFEELTAEEYREKEEK